MNTIFKIKWNVATQCYAVCSELVKRAGKPVAVGVAICSIFIALPAVAENINHPETQNEKVAKDITNQNQTIDGLNITMTPKAGASAKPKGVIVRGQSDSTISNLNANIQLASRSTTANEMADTNASYGVAVGYDYLGGANTNTSKLTLNNATINVSNTKDSVYGTFKKVVPNVGHQLSGIRIYRVNGATPELISNGDLNITVTDNSTKKVGDYLNGIYISGNGSSATLNGTTNIKLVSESSGINSAGIKIGKPLEKGVDTGKKGSTVTVNGKITIDTTGAKNTAGVRLFDNSSTFIITGNGTDEASKIKVASSAIVFDTQDYVIGKEPKQDPSRNSNGQNQVVKLTDTELSTISESASLIKARTQTANSIKVSFAKIFGVNLDGKLNNGTFTTQGSFTLSGEKSLAKAAKDGWLFEVEDGSELTALINKKAKVVGLSSKNTSGTLNVTLDDATWVLKAKENKENGAPTSTLNKLTLNSHAVLDASDPTDAAVTKAVYTVKLTSDGTKTDGILTNNSGVISLANKSYQDVLTIAGNYVGNNGVIKLNTNWNSPVDDVDGSDSHSDLVVIMGDASGTTTVQAINADGKENVIDGSIGSIAADLNKNSAVLIKVHGTDKGNDVADTAKGGKYRSTFTGEARTTGAGVLKLASRKNNNGHTEYFWTLTSINTNNINLDPVVPAYVLAPKVGLELGYTALATLHERRGKDQTAQVQGQTWGRFIGKHLALDGKNRLGAKHHSYGFQFGHDFAIQHTEEGDLRLTGGYVSYGIMNSTYSDRLDDQPQTGKGKQKGWNLGLTHTRYAPSGAYVDLVGQIGFLNNQFNARNGVEVKQKGTALALSAEIGLPYALREYPTKGVWLIEPQAQLVYQMLKLNSFKDDVKYIQGGYHHGLRGRLGVRAVYNVQSVEGKYRPNSVYITANVLHDFMNGKGVTIGQDKVKETLAKTWAEVGVGGQLPVGKQSLVYADVRYEHSLSGTKHEGYRGTVGFKYTWK
ncbi:autotransporter outer membrane beta-barrel domain-containing protein [Histophilus somni]|uniref:autotransporter outer membrane beta-barrel domain-containing protein n=2 Tax=Histophilus somni TaxID=731 RepID=UPI00109C6363|nr:autotransporter outer membrane beta-barrel domain-containing protein [Histophilus somni]THA21493.1 autotransporter outer membrane beta-barrel domain-containing protein [Histophilus somni]